MPEVSIIIPTHNRKAVLQECLEALALQSLPHHLFEVIVVADGCTDGTAEMLRQNQMPYTCSVVVQESGGAAAARNAGAAKANASVLIFLDDDIEAAPDFIKAHYEAHLHSPGIVAIGYSPPVLLQQKGLYKAQLNEWWQTTFINMQQPGHRFSYRDLLSGYFSVAAKLFRKVNGFDTTFKCQEDYELGYRLLKQGARFQFLPNAIGYHNETSKLNKTLQRKYLEGSATVQLLKAHPELIAQYPVINDIVQRKSLLPRLYTGLLFKGRFLLNALSFFFEPGLSVLESLHMRRRFFKVLGLVMQHAYLRGIAESVSGMGELRAMINKLSNKTTEKRKKVVVDLKEGITAAEAFLDKEQPMSMRLFFGNKLIGDVEGKPGGEPLRCVHLRHILATRFGKKLYDVMLSEGCITINNHKQSHHSSHSVLT